MEKRPFIIDCDPGIDDAVALFLAASREEFDIRAVTSVAGNVNIDLTTQNALDLCREAGLSTIVARGAAAPMLYPASDASFAHGVRGLGTVTLPASPQQEDPRHAWDVIYDEAVKAGGRLEIIALGPLTNLGILLTKYPDAARLIANLTIMGGSRIYGNQNAYGEYNLWADPTAADIVFRSGVPVDMVELETIFRAKLTSGDWGDLLACDHRIARLTGEIMRYKTERGEGMQDLITAKSDDPSPFLCDCMTVACVADPSIVAWKRCHVDIETEDGPSRGRTLVDFSPRPSGFRSCRVSMEVSREGFKRVMEEMFRFYEGK